MSAGLYPADFVIERYVSGLVAAGSLPQVLLAPCDLDVLGLMAWVGTAPGGTDSLTINISDSPTSQTGVAPYNLWSAAAVPTITGASQASFSTSTARSVIENEPYALDYPLPGPVGTSGFVTAQSSSVTTISPVIAPPSIAIYELNALTAPDEVYVDFNGFAGTPASAVHAGDVLTFVVGGVPGAAADLSVALFVVKH